MNVRCRLKGVIHCIELDTGLANQANGGNDTVARAIAQNLGASLGQPVIVDNRSGAGGIVGAKLALSLCGAAE